MKQLDPIKHPVSLIGLVEKMLARQLYLKLYKPLFLLLAKEHVTNDINVILSAIRRGDLVLKEGVLTGKFNAEITKELKEHGAVWVQERAGFLLPATRITAEFQQAIALAQEGRMIVASRIDLTVMRGLQELLADRVKIHTLIDDVYKKAAQRFETNVRRVIVAPKLTDQEIEAHAQVVKDRIILKYSDVAQKNVQKIRTDAYAHAMQGGRRDELAKALEKNYGIAENQAKFVAKNELNRAVAAFNQARYEAAGIKKYRWVCVHMPKDKTEKQHTPGNVRYFHGLLDKTVQRWDSPPIVARNPDRHAHPKEDYNCRCSAIPLFEGET